MVWRTLNSNTMEFISKDKPNVSNTLFCVKLLFALYNVYIILFIIYKSILSLIIDLWCCWTYISLRTRTKCFRIYYVLRCFLSFSNLIANLPTYAFKDILQKFIDRSPRRKKVIWVCNKISNDDRIFMFGHGLWSLLCLLRFVPGRGRWGSSNPVAAFLCKQLQFTEVP